MKASLVYHATIKQKALLLLHCLCFRN